MDAQSPSGIKALDQLLASMEPIPDSQPYVFLTIEEPITPEVHAVALAWFRESEAVTLILPAGDAPEISAEQHYARITLSVHSNLEAVGLTAAVAARLTECNIPANVVAAYYHDHLFVPWSQRTSAMEALTGLQREHQPSS